MRSSTTWIAAALLVATAGCEVGFPAGQEPFRETNWTDMGNQPKVKPQRGDLLGLNPTGTFAPPAGAVAQGEQPYPFRQDQAELAATALQNPLPHTPEVIAKGKWVWENACIACHGPAAAGDGKVAKLFPKPPHLMRQKVRDYTDARIFHVPMRGQGSMPPYGQRFTTDELWSVVHYIRDLQSKSPVAPPDPKDLQAAPAAAPADAAPAAAAAPVPATPTPAPEGK